MCGQMSVKARPPRSNPFVPFATYEESPHINTPLCLLDNNRCHPAANMPWYIEATCHVDSVEEPLTVVAPVSSRAIRECVRQRLNSERLTD